MRIAVIGSRNIKQVDLSGRVAPCDEIVSGGAVGVDACAAEYARANRMKYTEFLPQYDRYGRVAPIVRNREIVDYADKILVFWNGYSKGTLSVIKYAEKRGKPMEIVMVPDAVI